ncbi:GNAT family N-acetyltransferase [Ancylobacter sp. 6x-1]|uniref:GNAT family N-acetyltransferase n=1 Tax=Ancylobacter crimeensis TaxID=2579147 RepID=A0ABT0D9E4_9HYPH|nr:GNAT family N-acetyltransferase [Ancylobacter crimeensis]MCK0196557.1 GNAT family N-acetyltransferase [Ancylobacter crimeensis]
MTPTGRLMTQASTVLLDLDGYTTVPPGKIACIVTFLEMTARPAPLPERGTDGFTLDRVEAPDPGWYRALFRRIGEDWLWFSRLRMNDAALCAIIGHPDVGVHVLRRAGADLGLVELDFRVPGEVELAFVGLVPELVGSGAGRFLMNRALDLAFASRPERVQPKRVHVHTCTLDHPGALPFYIKAGFRPVGRAVEIADDPRAGGVLAPDAARHFPMLTAE